MHPLRIVEASAYIQSGIQSGERILKQGLEQGLAPFWESPHVATDCGVFLWEEENDMQRVNVNPHRDSTRPDPLP